MDNQYFKYIITNKSFIKKLRVKTIYNKTIAISILLISILLTGCSNINSNMENDTEKNPFISKSSFLLDTIVTVQIYDKQDQEILEGSFDVIKKYDLIFSRTKETSELYQLN